MDKTKGYHRQFLYLMVAAIGLASSGGLYGHENGAATDRDWTVAVSGDNKGCFATKEFDHPGRTTLLLGIDSDGSNRLTVLNENWSIKVRDKLELDFRLSGVSFPRHFAVGITSGQKKGFVTSFGGRFPTHFASSASLQIYRGNVPVEQLSLVGSAAAITRLQACVETQRRGSTVKRADNGKPAIPKDPFASGFDGRNNR